MKAVKINIMAELTIFLLLQFVIHAGPDSQTKTFEVSKGGKLVMKIDPGEIEISTWDRNEIKIVARGLDDDSREDLEIKKSGNNITVKYDADRGWSQNVDFIVNAPKDFHYEINTSSGRIRVNGSVKGSLDALTMSGEVRIDDVVGNVDVKTYGGEIRTGDLNGKTNLNTQGGGIRVGNIKTGPVRIETMGGEIKIRNVESSLNVKTYGGEIEIGDIGGDAEVVTYGGDIKVNNVAGSATLDTYGGDIRLKSASGIVEANTYGGDLSLYNITGSVDAKTAAGDIYVELNPSGKGRTKLETSMGKVELVLPANAKADIEAEIRLKGHYFDDRGDYQIKSDFKAESHSSTKNSKEIFASYKLNGGGEKIYIKTVNSDIEIRKAR